MVLCDEVHRDPATGKSTILGTFGTLGAREYPAPVKLCVYFAITDAIGDIEITFRLVDSKDIMDETVEPVFAFSLMVNSPNPLSVTEGSFGVRGMLPRPAVYHCEMFAGQDLLMSRRLVAVKIGSEGIEEQ